MKQPKFTSHSISLTAARQNLFELVESVVVTGQPITLTEHGQPKVALIAIDDFEAWLETQRTTPSRRQLTKRPVSISR